jgi:hypothetical protein
MRKTALLTAVLIISSLDFTRAGVSYDQQNCVDEGTGSITCSYSRGNGQNLLWYTDTTSGDCQSVGIDGVGARDDSNVWVPSPPRCDFFFASPASPCYPQSVPCKGTPVQAAATLPSE